MALLNQAACYFRDRSKNFMDSKTTKRDCAANAIEAWHGWIQLAEKDCKYEVVMFQVYKNIADVAEIGYGELSFEVAESQVNLGMFLLNQGPEKWEEAESCLESAAYILEIHYGAHYKRVLHDMLCIPHVATYLFASTGTALEARNSFGGCKAKRNG
jgi:hypothetical protein